MNGLMMDYPLTLSTIFRRAEAVYPRNEVVWRNTDRSVQRYDYDSATGALSHRRDFARWTGSTDRPDGAAVDSAGNYWVAFYRGGKVMQLAPDGRTIAEHPVPAMCPTMCAFGGPDLRTLYITSARQQRDADELARLPLSGGIFALQVDVPGLPEPRFAA